MEDFFDIIRGCLLFQNVSDEVLRTEILPRGLVKTYAAGESLFLQSDRVDRIGILLSGKVRLTYCTENGQEDIRNVIFPPRPIGIDLVCTRTRIAPYRAAAAARSSVFSFPASLILKQGTIPEKERLVFMDNLLLLLSRVNMQNEYRLAILTRAGLRERITVYLTMQANKAGSASFCVPFSREEMASFLCVNRSALSHELSLMRKEGILDFRKNEFTLLCRSGSEDGAAPF